jgi:hypothetical protein
VRTLAYSRRTPRTSHAALRDAAATDRQADSDSGLVRDECAAMVAEPVPAAR